MKAKMKLLLLMLLLLRRPFEFAVVENKKNSSAPFGSANNTRGSLRRELFSSPSQRDRGARRLTRWEIELSDREKRQKQKARCQWMHQQARASASEARERSTKK